MPVQDRTNEFLACVDSIISRTSIPSRRDTKQKLLQNGKSVTKSEFSRMASGIGKDISSTNIKLGKLSQRASLLVLLKPFVYENMQSRRGKRCLMTDQSKSACAYSFVSTDILFNTHFTAGTHLYNQARPC